MAASIFLARAAAAAILHHRSTVHWLPCRLSRQPQSFNSGQLAMPDKTPKMQTKGALPLLGQTAVRCSPYNGPGPRKKAESPFPCPSD
jgi:hypothetical protein